LNKTACFFCAYWDAAAPNVDCAASFDVIEVVHSLLPSVVSVEIFRANPLFRTLVRTDVMQGCDAVGKSTAAPKKECYKISDLGESWLGW
tara:strand:+ start:548 stop:817 length:270 start_codon:yes stop_codon:yes gene_type:complete